MEIPETIADPICGYALGQKTQKILPNISTERYHIKGCDTILLMEKIEGIRLEYPLKVSMSILELSLLPRKLAERMMLLL
jgi:hypothetical protein